MPSEIDDFRHAVEQVVRDYGDDASIAEAEPVAIA